MSRENTLAAVFTPKLKRHFFTYLHGFADNFTFPPKLITTHDLRKTKFWFRFGPVTNFTEQEIERQLHTWLMEFCRERNSTE